MAMGEHERKTYRYLRIAMVLLVVALAASVLVEWQQTGRDCFQTSISAYYYTPAQGLFVGALVAIGVCLVVIKGNTETEDVLLNLAGMLAPVVAFVPTPYEESCYSVRVDDAEMRAGVANNMSALLITGTVALLFALLLWSRTGRDRRHLWGLLAAAAVVALGAVAFAAARERFLDLGHYGAAIPMFGLIVAVAVQNARESAALDRDRSRTAYSLVAATMVAAVALGSVLLLVGWTHAVIAIEVALIGLFAAFWTVQTADLWYAGRRTALRGQARESITSSS